MPVNWAFFSLIHVCLALAAFADVAQAQIVLPGAQPPLATGQTVQPPASAKILPAVTHPPEPETIIGRQFQHNGREGVLTFERGPTRTPAIGRLAFVGFQISNPVEACRVEISGGRIDVRPAARNEGLESYEVAMSACPFSFDVLDGAVRIRGNVCEIAAADCRVDPAGVWGPSGGSIGAEDARNIEAVRARAETESQASYRALVGLSSTDPKRTRDLARDQAGFSSVREEICRNYLGEERHGFCASRITQAHAISLSTRLHGEPAQKPVAARAPRPRPAAPVALPGVIQ